MYTTLFLADRVVPEYGCITTKCYFHYCTANGNEFSPIRYNTLFDFLFYYLSFLYGPPYLTISDFFSALFFHFLFYFFSFLEFSNNFFAFFVHIILHYFEFLALY